jgi:hypothetical protein
METQNKRIEAYLMSGRTLTPLDALHEFNCFRLSARIYDLRKRGLDIESRRRKITSDGKQKVVVEYKLKN